MLKERGCSINSVKWIAATGTTRANRLSSQKLSALKVSEKTKDHVPWGTVYAREHKEQDVMQFGFKDNVFVLLLSTAFEGWEPKDEKIRRQPAKTSTSKDCQGAFSGTADKAAGDSPRRRNFSSFGSQPSKAVLKRCTKSIILESKLHHLLFFVPLGMNGASRDMIFCFFRHF